MARADFIKKSILVLKLLKFYLVSYEVSSSLFQTFIGYFACPKSFSIQNSIF
jgi:hypothetical protein